MSVLRALAIAFLCASWLGAPSVAEAKPKKLSQADKDKAKKYFEDAKALQDSGEYAGAADSYKKAYAIIPEPLLLFNIGQVYRLDGKKRLAYDYYKRYLEAEPDGRGAPIATKFVDEIESQLEKEKEAEKARQAKEAEERQRQLAEMKEKEAEEQDRKKNERLTRTDEPSKTGKVLKWSGIGTAVVGAATVGLGIKYGLDAKKISDDLSANDAQWTPALLAKQDEGESAETKMFIFTALGSAAIVGGGVLYFFGHRADQASEERELSFVPVTTTESVGFAMTGRF